MSRTTLAVALEQEVRDREEQARILTAEAVELRKALDALNHKLNVNPQIKLPEGTRKEQLVAIINLLDGEASRSQINSMAERAGIPLGTIASMLGSKHHRRVFYQRNGKWAVSSQLAAAQPAQELVAAS